MFLRACLLVDYFAPWIFSVRHCHPNAAPLPSHSTISHRAAAAPKATIKDHELVHKMLSEMTAVMGCDERAGERNWITDLNIRWQDDFLLSGSTIGLSTANISQRVWRFTPLDPTAFMPKTTASASGHAGNPGNITIPVSMHLYGADRPCVLGFEQAVLSASTLRSSSMPPPHPTRFRQPTASSVVILGCWPHNLSHVRRECTCMSSVS